MAVPNITKTDRGIEIGQASDEPRKTAKKRVRVRQDSVLTKDFLMPSTESERIEEEATWVKDQIQYERKSMMMFAKERIDRALATKGATTKNIAMDHAIEVMDISKLDVGKIIGKGAFGIVREIGSIGTLGTDNPATHSDLRENPEKYVLKKLRPELLDVKSSHEMTKIAADLVKEGMILAQAKGHRNVLGIVGWNGEGLDGYFSFDDKNDSRLLRPEGFGLVLNRLSGDLKDRLNEWKQRANDMRKQWKKGLVSTQIMLPKDHSFRSLAQYRDFWMERLDVARQLAEGIGHLHSHRIIHRDLKPENVGFDYSNRTELKIFDFNVARKLPLRRSRDSQEDAVFHMTRMVGSRRYMAPEVALRKEYNQKVDIYAFALLAYEILALPVAKKIFPNINTVEEHTIRVYMDGERPKLPQEWNSNLRMMIESSWSHSIHERPSGTSLATFFEKEIAKIETNASAPELQVSVIRKKKKEPRAIPKRRRFKFGRKVMNISGESSSTQR